MACGPGPWPLRAQIPRDRGNVLNRGRRPDRDDAGHLGPHRIEVLVLEKPAHLLSYFTLTKDSPLEIVMTFGE
jgi:hypothetical protein